MSSLTAPRAVRFDQRDGAMRPRLRYKARWLLNHRPQDRQKPSSARPTQLNANTPETIAASDAKVTIVWTDGITELRLQTAHIL
jgi:hypothetical protein